MAGRQNQSAGVRHQRGVRDHLADRIKHLEHQTLALLEQDEAFRRFRLLAQQQRRGEIGTHPNIRRKEELIEVQVPDCLQQPPAYKRDRLILPLRCTLRGIAFEGRSQLIEKIRQGAGYGGHNSLCS